MGPTSNEPPQEVAVKHIYLSKPLQTKQEDNAKVLDGMLLPFCSLNQQANPTFTGQHNMSGL